MSKNATIAVLGCGYWGKNLVRSMAELGALAAVADAHAATAEAMAKQYNVRALSVDAILADGAIAGIVIAAPAAQHAALAIRALEAGKHVFVEKPLALTVADAEKVAAVAARTGKVLMVGHLLQYHAAYQALAEKVREGAIGKLLYVYSHRLNLGKIRTEENVLWSFAPHDISMILGLFGEAPVAVSAQGTAHLTPNLPDICSAQMRFTSGASAHVFVSWLNPTKEQKLTVVGERGMFVFDDSKPWAEKLVHFPHTVKWVNQMPQPEKADGVAVAVPEGEPLKAECQHFLDAISGAPTRTDAAEGLRVLRVLEAAERAMQTNAEVPMQPSPKLPYFVHETALVDDGCTIGEGTKIWHFSHILGGTVIGRDCVISQNVMIGPNVIVGNQCKIQNNVSLYKGVELADGVFCGPSCVFTNVNTPRAQIERKDAFLPTKVGTGATIGANATIVCGNEIGAYALIGAGSVVTKLVKPHALMVGNPARQTGWVSHAGEKLGTDLVCPREGRRYRITTDEQLEEISKESTHGTGKGKKHAA